MAPLTCEKMTKAFGSYVAVKELQLDIPDGEFLVIVGPSGCGKSTALRCIAGLEEITSGRLLIGDDDVTRIPPMSRDIAMVFQSYALHPHMDVRANLAFGLRHKGMPKDLIATKIEQIAAALELTPLLDRRPRELSGGQRQRVALGRAIVHEPRIFLMDEPLSNLDAKLRVNMRAELITLQKRLGTTTVYVTHDKVEARTMGHRIAIMDARELQQLATPQEIYDKPANRFVATFIGNPAMNIIRVKLSEDAGALRGEGGPIALEFESADIHLPRGRRPAASFGGHARHPRVRRREGARADVTSGSRGPPEAPLRPSHAPRPMGAERHVDTSDCKETATIPEYSAASRTKGRSL